MHTLTTEALLLVPQHRSLIQIKFVCLHQAQIRVKFYTPIKKPKNNISHKKKYHWEFGERKRKTDGQKKGRKKSKLFSFSHSFSLLFSRVPKVGRAIIALDFHIPLRSQRMSIWNTSSRRHHTAAAIDVLCGAVCVEHKRDRKQHQWEKHQGK